MLKTYDLNLKQEFYSNGKLLLTGEYVVLDGATALALPTKYGQSLEISSSRRKEISWKSLDETNTIWFEATFKVEEKNIELITPENSISHTLLKILQEAKKMNPSFLQKNDGYIIETKLNFPINWGLGTSSTLINNIAQWAEINPFQLLKKSFGGSGYDIAAAQHNYPILYTTNNKKPQIRKAGLQWDFTEKLFFVHLNQKQNSKEGIALYKKANVEKNKIERITDISNKLLLCYTLKDFESLLTIHELIISEIINIPTIKETLFNDYPNVVKSLGAWGGDFILATGDKKDQEYFKKKGFATIISYAEMIK